MRPALGDGLAPNNLGSIVVQAKRQSQYQPYQIVIFFGNLVQESNTRRSTCYTVVRVGAA